MIVLVPCPTSTCIPRAMFVMFVTYMNIRKQRRSMTHWFLTHKRFHIYLLILVIPTSRRAATVAWLGRR
ncbi:hypothetical protein F5Y09DRAFT_317897 [Xylaria sp. FL1042]|nr:hypothetical protein F5Y09DRAFT_317897 [Xylaria sp. FL1042]